MQHALTVQHENRHYWNIKNYTFGIKEYETKHAVSVQSEDLSLFEILDAYGEQKQQQKWILMPTHTTIFAMNI